VTSPHSLIGTVVVSWMADEGVHTLEVRGKILNMLAKAKPASEAGRSCRVVGGNLKAA